LSEPLALKTEEKTAAIKLSEPIVDKDRLSPAKPEKKSVPAADEPKIALSLKAVLKSLPAFQIDGDVAKVSDDAQVQLPMSIVEPQLASGRVSIVPDTFKAAMPEAYRELLHVDETKTPVMLPLEEVLKNLPATVLKLRDDQEYSGLEKDFETPFSIKAKEDEKKFGADKKPDKKAPAKSEEPKPEAKINIEPAVEKKLDPKEVVSEVNALDGIKACAITFSDGLSLAGELPENAAAEGLCAMAPAILSRISQHVRATKLGNLVAMTIHTSNSAVSFFAQENICLTALDADGSLPAETRTKVAELVKKLSEQYTKTE